MTAVTPEVVAALGGPDWLARERREALERFASTDMPSDAEEIWRYSRIGDLDLDRYRPVGPPGPGAPVAHREPAASGRAATVVVDNGTVSSIEVSPEAARAGLRVGRLSEEPDPGCFGQIGGSADALGHLSTALSADGVVVQTRPGAVIREPVVILHRLSGDGLVVPARTVVSAGPNSQAVVAEEVQGGGDLLFLPIVELDVGDGANLDYAGVQRLGREAWQVGHLASRLGRDAGLRSVSVALGGHYARLRTDSRLVAAGASSRLLALYFGDGDQMHDFRTLQEHAAPRTSSDLLFKGAVADRAQGVYSGLIRVHKGASGTNAFQTNRNLVLSDGAMAWSVPNLEIEENDVRCSHASAVGPVDEEQLYYLESRGIRPEVAARLIVVGFFEELLAALPLPAWQEELHQLLAAKLEGVTPAGAGSVGPGSVGPGSVGPGSVGPGSVGVA